MDLPTLDLDQIPDAATRRAVQLLLNLLEQLHAQLQALQADNQRLRDEIRRLTGQSPRPTFPTPRSPNSSQHSATDRSSEAERREPKPHHKRPKLQRIVIDRVQVLGVDPALLPADAQFKGYQPVVVQNLKLVTDNVLFQKEVYYSPSRGRTFLAE